MDKKHLFVGILILYVAVLIIGAVLPPSGIVRNVGEYDKVIHTLEFFFLMIILLKTLQFYKFKKFYILGGLIGIVLMFVSESLQLLTPSRSFSYMDMLADLLGMAVGMIVYYALMPRE